MSGRPVAGWLPWVPCSLTMVLVVVSLLLPPNANTSTILTGGQSLGLLLTLQALTFAAVGLVLARARPDNSIARLFSFVGVLDSLETNLRGVVRTTMGPQHVWLWL